MGKPGYEVTEGSITLDGVDLAIGRNEYVALVGPSGGTMVALTVVISTFGCNAAAILAGRRAGNRRPASIIRLGFALSTLGMALLVLFAFLNVPFQR